MHVGSEFGTKKAMSDEPGLPKKTQEMPEPAAEPPTQQSAAEPEADTTVEPAPKKVAARG